MVRREYPSRVYISSHGIIYYPSYFVNASVYGTSALHPSYWMILNVSEVFCSQILNVICGGFL